MFGRPGGVEDSAIPVLMVRASAGAALASAGELVLTLPEQTPENQLRALIWEQLRRFHPDIGGMPAQFGV